MKSLRLRTVAVLAAILLVSPATLAFARGGHGGGHSGHHGGGGIMAAMAMLDTDMPGIGTSLITAGAAAVGTTAATATDMVMATGMAMVMATAAGAVMAGDVTTIAVGHR